MLADLGSYQDWTVVVDLEASPEHMSRGTARNVDVLILVAEPYYRSLAAVGRLAVLATELPIPRVAVVLNKVRGPEDALAMGEFCINHGLECLGELPWSEEILGADRAGVCLFDYMPDGEVVTAVSSLVDRLETVSGTREGSVSMSAQAVI
jgi:CO dehydrogenase maturation factor